MAGKRLLSAVSAAAFIIGAMMIPVSAGVSAAGDAKGTLTVDCGVEGMEWNLYEVAGIGDSGELVWTSDFSELRIPDRYINYNDAIQEVAGTVENYIELKTPDPVRSGKSDGSGKARFAELEEAWYIAVPEKLTVDRDEYTSKSAMICITDDDIYGGFWSTNVSINAKVDHRVKPEEEKKKVVIIQFEPSPEDENPPKEITVIIYRDGSPFKEIILDDTNNWTYILPDLPDDDSKWVVIQKDVPENKFPLYDDEHTVIEDTPTEIITIINKTDKEVPPVTSDSSVTTRTTLDGSPDVTDVTKDDNIQFNPGRPVTVTTVETTRRTVVNNPPSNDSSLPQTGQLWWPVPLLTASGLLLTVIGISVNKKNQR